MLYFEFACLATSSLEDAKDLQTIMYTLRDSLPHHEIQRFSIHQQELWEDSVAAFKNPKFNETYAPRVKFLGEAGIDAGGLSREYGTILRKELFSAQACLFEGEETRKLPIYNINGIQSNLFYLAGKMVAYLIIHFDIGIPLLSPVFYHYIVNQNITKASEHIALLMMFLILMSRHGSTRCQQNIFAQLNIKPNVYVVTTKHAFICYPRLTMQKLQKNC